MHLGARSDGDVPDGSDVAAIRSAHRGGVITVVLALAEEKNVLMATRRPVFHALRLAIQLVPNDIGPKIPAFPLQGEGQQPGTPIRSLGFNPSGVDGRTFIARAGVLLVGRPRSTTAGCVPIADVKL